MKRLIMLLLCGVLTISGCRQHAGNDNDASSSEEQSASNAHVVEMSLSAQQHAGLTISPAEVKQLNQFLQVVGTVKPIDSRIAQISPLAQGRILEVRAKIGDRFEAGQTLATFDNIEAGELVAQELSARADLERLKAQLIPASRQTERSRRLADIGAGAERDFESSQAQQDEIEAEIRSQQALIEGLRRKLHRFGVAEAAISGDVITALRAPFAGVVTKAQASPGDEVDAGRIIFTVADLSRVWVQAEVYEKDLGRIRVGQSAIITVDTYPTRSFQGKVAYISDVIDPQTRTADVRCEVPNPGTLLKVDMLANVELPTKLSRSALAVPSSAVQDIEGKLVVFIRRTPTKFEAREVEKGATVDGMTEIVRGLSAGEPVVAQGAFQLKSILAVGGLGDND